MLSMIDHHAEAFSLYVYTCAHILSLSVSLSPSRSNWYYFLSRIRCIIISRVIATRDHGRFFTFRRRESPGVPRVRTSYLYNRSCICLPDRALGLYSCRAVCNADAAAAIASLSTLLSHLRHRRRLRRRRRRRRCRASCNRGCCYSSGCNEDRAVHYPLDMASALIYWLEQKSECSCGLPGTHRAPALQFSALRQRLNSSEADAAAVSSCFCFCLTLLNVAVPDSSVYRTIPPDHHRRSSFALSLSVSSFYHFLLYPPSIYPVAEHEWFLCENTTPSFGILRYHQF